MAGQAYAAGGIVTTMTATPGRAARPTSSPTPAASAGRPRRRAPRSWRPRPATASTWPASCGAPGRPRRWPTWSASSAPTWCRRASTGATTSTWSPARCSRPSPRTSTSSTPSARPGAFDVEESREVLLAGRAAGLGLRLHGNQLGFSGGVRLAVELGCASVDHCNHLDDADIDALAGSNTVATLLPACDLSTRQPFPPARRLLDAGVHDRPGQQLQPRHLVHHVDAVLRGHGGAADGPHRARGGLGGDPRRGAGPWAASTGRMPWARSGSAAAPTCRCSMPPRWRTSPTGPVCRSAWPPGPRACAPAPREP